MLARELGSTPGLRVGLVGSLFVCVWQKSATLPDLVHLDALQTDLVPRLRTFSMITLVSMKSAALAGPGVREKAADMARRFDPSLIASALVLPDEGVIAGITRAFITAHQLVFRHRSPIRVCRTLEDACQHLRTAPGQSRALADLTDLPTILRTFQMATPPHLAHAHPQG